MTQHRLWALISKAKQRLPLRVVLLVPFLLQIAGVTGLVGYWSFRNGERAVNDLAQQVQGELTARIEQELSTYFATPPTINQISAAAFLQGELPLAQGNQAATLLRQLKLSPYLYSIYCGNEQGEFLGTMRLLDQEDSVGIWNANAATGYHQFHFYADHLGNRGQLFRDAGAYDPRQRPWYKTAKRQERPVWGDVYVAFSSQQPALTASQPVYDRSGQQVVGVCATDVLLTDDLRQFLSSLTIGKTGQAFVIDRHGVLLSSSTNDPLTLGEGKDKTLMQASLSQNPLVKGSMEQILAEFVDLAAIQDPTQLVFKVEGQRQLVQLVPFRDDYGLDLLIVLVLPEADVMGDIQASTRTTFLLCVAALGLATWVGVITSRRLSHPLLTLSQASQTMAAGQWQPQVIRSNIREVQVLSQSFNLMAQDLQQSFQALEQANADLERRVEERTAALAQRAEQDHLLRQISQRLINEDIALAIHYALRQVGVYTDSDRCYLVHFNGASDQFLITYQWQGGTQLWEQSCFQGATMESLPWLYYNYRLAQPIQWDSTTPMPPEGQGDQQMIAASGVAALLLVPMQTMGEMVGWIGLDTSQAHRQWSPDSCQLLQLVGEMIAMTQVRYEVEKALRLERAKSDQLLLNILPASIADQLKQDIRPIAEHFEDVSILFADIVNFTPLSSRLSAVELVNILNQVFSTFDELAGWLGLEKIKTIGDAYMVAAGLPVPRADHLDTIADMALAMVNAMSLFSRNHDEHLQIRIGIHFGPVVAGVIGVKKFTYDLWGDTVNVASRMEALGKPGLIQVTESVYEQLRDRYHFEERGLIQVKGKGIMRTYWLLRKRHDWDPVPELDTPTSLVPPDHPVQSLR